MGGEAHGAAVPDGEGGVGETGEEFHKKYQSGVAFHKKSYNGEEFHKNVKSGGEFHKKLQSGEEFHKNVKSGVEFHRKMQSGEESPADAQHRENLMAEREVLNDVGLIFRFFKCKINELGYCTCIASAMKA